MTESENEQIAHIKEELASVKRQIEEMKNLKITDKVATKYLELRKKKNSYTRKIASIKKSIEKRNKNKARAEKLWNDMNKRTGSMFILERVDGCSGCPHLERDPHYNMSQDSGYDCRDVGKRIIDDHEYDILKSGGIHKIPVPEWCKLPIFNREQIDTHINEIMNGDDN